MIRWTGEAPAGTPYWWEVADWPDLSAPPPGKVDVLIVGAGFTGLSAAIAAHDAGARVAVIDAGQPGQGASTRNGGMVGAHPRLGWDRLVQLYGAETADGVFAEAADALDFVRDLVAREQIDCDWQDTGRIQLAWTEAHRHHQTRLAESVTSKSRVTCRTVPQGGLAADIRTPCYKGGLIFEDHAAVHPWKYHNGLLQAVLRRNIPVSAHCPARSLTARRVETEKGPITADKVILATNGYTPKAFGWFARRVFPLPSFLIATEPLSENLIGDLAPGRRMMVETRARHSYFRISPDGTRIVYGGRASMAQLDLAEAARRLYATMCEVWPALEGTALSHVWSGNTGYTFRHMPSVGEKDGIHYALGFSGSGTVLAPYLGAKAAWQALGDPTGQTAYSKTTMTSRWFYGGGTPHFLQAADFWYRNWVDGAENRAARR